MGDDQLAERSEATEEPANAREQLEAAQLGVTIAEYRAWRERKRQHAINPPRLSRQHPLNQPPPRGRSGRR